MANPNFNYNLENKDASFIERLQTQYIYDSGVEVEYLPRTVMNKDPILMEPLSSVFKEAIALDVRPRDTLMFSAGNQILSPEGFAFSFNQASVEVSRSEFIKRTGMESPQEGDLLFIKSSKILFELINVNNRDSVLSGGRQFLFIMYLKPFEWGEGSLHFDNINDANTSSPLAEILEDMVNTVDQTKWRDGCKDDDLSMLDMSDNLGLQSQNKDFECTSAKKVNQETNPFGFG